jgi:hypothetical protein
MVMISGMVAILVANPAKMNSEQATSANTARDNESLALIPNTAGNCTGASEKSIISLGIPWINIRVAIPILAINSATPAMVVDSLTLNIFLIFIVFDHTKLPSQRALLQCVWARNSLASEQEKMLTCVNAFNEV